MPPKLILSRAVSALITLLGVMVVVFVLVRVVPGDPIETMAGERGIDAERLGGGDVVLADRREHPPGDDPAGIAWRLRVKLNDALPWRPLRRGDPWRSLESHPLLRAHRDQPSRAGLGGARRAGAPVRPLPNC